MLLLVEVRERGHRDYSDRLCGRQGQDMVMPAREPRLAAHVRGPSARRRLR